MLLLLLRNERLPGERYCSGIGGGGGGAGSLAGGHAGVTAIFEFCAGAGVVVGWGFVGDSVLGGCGTTSGGAEATGLARGVICDVGTGSETGGAHLAADWGGHGDVDGDAAVGEGGADEEGRGGDGGWYGGGGAVEYDFSFRCPPAVFADFSPPTHPAGCHDVSHDDRFDDAADPLRCSSRSC